MQFCYFLNPLKRLMKTSTLYILSHSDVLYIGRATHYCQYKHFVNLKIDHGGQANTAYIILWHHNIHVKLFRSWCITLGGSQCTRYQKLWAPFQHQYDDVHLNCSDSDISIIKSIYTNHKISLNEMYFWIR